MHGAGPMIRVATILGARPQFVKAAAVSRAFHSRPEIEESIVHTGQHYDENMSQRFFDELEIPPPRFDLNIGSGTHGVQTGRMLEAIEQVLMRELRPDVVLVYGDTNTTLAGALAAAKLHIPVAHVEAGLRSYNRRMPEEINRTITDHISDILFAPTETAVSNLESEGLDRYAIHLVGDVMFDVTTFATQRALTTSTIIDDLQLSPGHYILATVHRAENTDDPRRLAAILGGLRAVSAELPVVLPLHPRTREVMARDPRMAAAAEGVRILEPLGYFEMTVLEHHAALVATDSGGVQKEAFFHRVPCVTLRDETEWTELVELGWNRLCRPASAEEVAAALRAAVGRKGRADAAPYGDGRAAHHIADRLVAFVRERAAA